MKIKEVYKLGFDPATCEDEEVRRVFKDDIAKVLWVTIKSQHLASQYFNREMLEAADRIRSAAKGYVYRLYFDEFVRACGLDYTYGKVADGIRDNEFWYGIYLVVCKHGFFKVEYEPPQGEAKTESDFT